MATFSPNFLAPPVTPFLAACVSIDFPTPLAAPPVSINSPMKPNDVPNASPIL